MAKKSRDAQAASIFFDSSWVQPWGSPFTQPPATQNTTEAFSTHFSVKGVMYAYGTIVCLKKNKNLVKLF